MTDQSKTARTIRTPARLPRGAGRAIWKLVGGDIHVYDEREALLHKVELSASDKIHLAGGGSILLVHACGTEFHVKLPHIR